MDYLTSKEAAEILSIGQSQVRKLCQNRKLPDATKRGRDWWIPMTAINHYRKVRRAPGRPKMHPTKRLDTLEN